MKVVALYHQITEKNTGQEDKQSVAYHLYTKVQPFLFGKLADMLNSLSKGRIKINMELSGTEEPLEKIGNFIRYIVMAIISCVLFIGSCILSNVDVQPKTENGMPLIAVGGIVFSIALAIYSLKKMAQK